VGNNSIDKRQTLDLLNDKVEKEYFDHRFPTEEVGSLCSLSRTSSDKCTRSLAHTCVSPEAQDVVGLPLKICD
jgi:hypothetical protein